MSDKKLTFHQTLSTANFKKLMGTETVDILENKNGNLFGVDDAGNIICNCTDSGFADLANAVVSQVSDPENAEDTPSWLIHKRGVKKEPKGSF